MPPAPRSGGSASVIVGAMARRGRTLPWVLLFAAIGLALAFYGGGGWYFSSMIHDRALASEPYDPAGLQTGRVVSITGKGNGGTITVVADGAERDATDFDGAVVGLAVGESLVVAGPVSEVVEGRRTRPIRDVVGGRPEPGQAYGLARDVWLDPEQAGLEAKDVTITTPENLKFPAWRIDADTRSTRWAILVHGRGAARSEMLRMGTVLHDADYNLLVVTYTGDAGVPAYPDGMNQYGRTEWRELEAAVEYAREQGARQIVLGGASHGGAVVLGFLARSPASSAIQGVVLDAPASSLRDVIDEAAENESLPIAGLPIPESLEDVAMTLVAWRYGVNYGTVDYSGKTGLVKVPLLTIQGAADRTVPQSVNDRFMNDGAGQGSQYLVVPGAGHVLSWNVDPEGYTQALTRFVSGLSSS